MSIEDTAPEYPALGYIVERWAELAATRAHGMGGPAPIQFAEIEAWSRLTARPLIPAEVEMLRRIDIVFLRCMRDTDDEQS